MKKTTDKSQKTFYRLDFPSIAWRSDYWPGLIGFFIGLIPLFFPNLTDIDWYRTYRIPIGIILVLMPAIIPIFLWVWRTLDIASKRICQFPELFENYNLVEQEKQDLQRNFYCLLTGLPEKEGVELVAAEFQKSRYVITIRKMRSEKFQKGDLVAVVDRRDNLVLGNFEIIQIRSGDYIAENRNSINPVWAGDIREKGTISILPNLFAYKIPQGVPDGRDY